MTEMLCPERIERRRRFPAILETIRCSRTCSLSHLSDFHRHALRALAKHARLLRFRANSLGIRSTTDLFGDNFWLTVVAGGFQSLDR
jgi:hypothetical protein